MSVIPDVLLALIGFTGDIIIEVEPTSSAGGSFQVKSGLAYPTAPEQEQINRIAKLGWYFKELDALAKKYSVRMRNYLLDEFDSDPQPYLIAFYQGIQDLLTEYCDDVSYLEQLSMSDELSSVGMLTQHLQKYLIVFPEIHAICIDMVESDVKGCLVLDYLSQLNRGVSILNDVVNRALLHVRVVFMKQCVSWMLLGDLDGDFFIQRAASRGSIKSIRNIGGISSGIGNIGSNGLHNRNAEMFDWNRTYSINIDNVPTSYVNSKIAPKILFCGKSVQLLNHSNDIKSSAKGGSNLSSKSLFEAGISRESGDSSQSEKSEKSCFAFIFSYFGKGAKSNKHRKAIVDETPSKMIIDSVASGGNGGGISNGDMISAFESNAQGGGNAGGTPFAAAVDSRYAHEFKALARTLEYNGYEGEDVARFIMKFEKVILETGNSLIIFENVVNDMFSTISSKLWNILRDQYGFLELMYTIRNLYLLGKGEFYQCIFDSLLALTVTDAGSVSGSATGSPDTYLHDDDLLDWKVVRSTAKLLNVDEEILSKVIKFHVNSQSISIGGNGGRISAQDVKLFGSARIEKADAAGSSPGYSVSSASFIRLCHLKSGLDNGESNSSADDLANEIINKLKKVFYAADKGSGMLLSSNNKRNKTKQMGANLFCFGGFSFPDAKFVSKGFRSSITLFTDWSAVKSKIISTVGDDLLQNVGNFAFILHNSRHSVDNQKYVESDIVPQIAYPHESLSVSLAIYAKGGDSRCLFIKVEVNSHTNQARDSQLVAESTIMLQPPSWFMNDSRSNTTLGSKYLSLVEPWVLDIDYSRQQLASSVIGSNPNQTGLMLKVRLAAESSLTRGGGVSSSRGAIDDGIPWDINVSLDLSRHVRLKNGDGHVSLVGSGLVCEVEGTRGVLASSPIGRAAFEWDILQMNFEGKDIFYTYPVASPYTCTHYPETAQRLHAEVSMIRKWIHLKLHLSIPKLFNIILDSEAMDCYNRVFSLLMKVRIIDHSLQDIWMNVEPRLAENRMYCHLRHSLHFFISNLLYYLQVDVIDSEFSVLINEIYEAQDFQTVLRVHRTFIANIANFSMIDNELVTDAIERVLQVTIRFIAVCRILNVADGGVGGGKRGDRSGMPQSRPMTPHAAISRSSANTTSIFTRLDEKKIILENWRDMPIIVPSEELDSIRREFFSNISYLIQIMKKTENKGFLFRLDFNGYMSQVVAENLGSFSSVLRR